MSSRQLFFTQFYSSEITRTNFEDKQQSFDLNWFAKLEKFMLSKKNQNYLFEVLNLFTKLNYSLLPLNCAKFVSKLCNQTLKSYPKETLVIFMKFFAKLPPLYNHPTFLIKIFALINLNYQFLRMDSNFNAVTIAFLNEVANINKIMFSLFFDIVNFEYSLELFRLINFQFIESLILADVKKLINDGELRFLVETYLNSENMETKAELLRVISLIIDYNPFLIDCLMNEFKENGSQLMTVLLENYVYLLANQNTPNSIERRIFCYTLHIVYKICLNIESKPGIVFKFAKEIENSKLIESVETFVFQYLKKRAFWNKIYHLIFLAPTAHSETQNLINQQTTPSDQIDTILKTLHEICVKESNEFNSFQNYIVISALIKVFDSAKTQSLPDNLVNALSVNSKLRRYDNYHFQIHSKIEEGLQLVDGSCVDIQVPISGSINDLYSQLNNKTGIPRNFVKLFALIDEQFIEIVSKSSYQCCLLYAIERTDPQREDILVRLIADADNDGAIIRTILSCLQLDQIRFPE